MSAHDLTALEGEIRQLLVKLSAAAADAAVDIVEGHGDEKWKQAFTDAETALLSKVAAYGDACRIDELEHLTLNKDMTPEWLIARIKELQAHSGQGGTE